MDARDEMQSEKIGQLAKALSLAHGKMKALGKAKSAQIKSEKGNYSYQYADLADVIDVYRGPLSDNALAVTQTLRIADGHMVLVTKLAHESGEFIDSEYPLANYTRPQEQGSAITYARRYAVTALLGIAAEEDDDGKRATDSERHDEREDDAHADPKALGDAGAILDLAAALQERNPGKSLEALIEAGSEFTDKGGVKRKFDDPRRKLGSPAWLASTRKRMEAELHKANLKAEPGVEAGAAALR
jgi:hypothetical protein